MTVQDLLNELTERLADGSVHATDELEFRPKGTHSQTLQLRPWNDDKDGWDATEPGGLRTEDGHYFAAVR